MEPKPFSDEEIKDRHVHLEQKKALLRASSGSGNALNFIETLEDRYIARLAADRKRIEELKKEMRERTRLWHNANIEVKQQVATIAELKAENQRLADVLKKISQEVIDILELPTITGLDIKAIGAMCERALHPQKEE